MYIDRNDQMCTYVYTVYSIHLFLQVIIVFLQQWCVSGTSEVHFRGPLA